MNRYVKHALFIIEPLCILLNFRSLNDLMTTRISKGLAIFYGVFSYVLTFFVQNIPGLVQVMNKGNHIL